MLSVFVKIIFALLLLQLLGGLGRILRGGKRREKPRKTDDERVKTPDYGHLTKEPIEDADYEELPRE